MILEAPYVWNVFTRLYCVILDIQELDITSPQILQPIVNYCGKIINFKKTYSLVPIFFKNNLQVGMFVLNPIPKAFEIHAF